jgi:predicted site-specific integrase-resolvase
MTAMTTVNGKALEALTVGQVAEQFGVTVCSLHHYDEIGLLVPSQCTPAGYRHYTTKDITRLQHVVVYRRLGSRWKRSPPCCRSRWRPTARP